MKDYQKTLNELLELENELQFESFTNKMALELGMLFIKLSEEKKYAVTIDITKSGQQIFHYSFDGTVPDNDEWVRRKIRVVNRLHHSSYYFHCYLEQEGKTIDERYHISNYEYSPYGGCFPLIIKNVGVVGTVTISGLPQEEDHAFAVEGLRAYLKSLK